MKPQAQKTLYLLALLLGLFIWLPHSAVSADPEPTSVTTEVTEGQANNTDLRDPAALAELKRATDFLVALPNFRIKASVAYDVIQEDGRRLQFEKQGDIFLQRPNRLFVEVRLDDGRHRQLWYDGKTLSLAERSKKIHTQVDAPPTIDATLDMLEDLFKDPMPLADILYSDLTHLTELAFEADVVGNSLVNDKPCQHLAFRGETIDWQIWVEQGATPFIRKLAISYRQAPGTPQYVAALDLWETPGSFSNDLFTFTAPPGSESINILVPEPNQSEAGGQP